MRESHEVRSAVSRFAAAVHQAHRAARVIVLGAGPEAYLAVACLPPAIRITGVRGGSGRVRARFAGELDVPALSNNDTMQALRAADGVIATGVSAAQILAGEGLESVLAGRIAPLVVLDLGVPRSISPRMACRDGISVIAPLRRRKIRLDPVDQRKSRQKLLCDSPIRSQDGPGVWWSRGGEWHTAFTIPKER